MNQVQLVKALVARIGLPAWTIEADEHRMKLGFRANGNSLNLVTVEITCDLVHAGTGNRSTVDPSDWQIGAVTGVNPSQVFKVDQESPKS